MKLLFFMVLKLVTGWSVAGVRRRSLPDFATHTERIVSLLSLTRSSMLRWFHALMPKEERFFELFASVFEQAVQRFLGVTISAERLYICM